MATIMESDTKTWLNNKLGSDDDLWSSGGIASQFTSMVMQNICECFTELNSSLKIKTLLSMLEVPFRNLNHFADEMNTIVRLGEQDNDDWVKVAASIVKDYPEEQTIDQNIKLPLFKETLEEITSEISNIDVSRLNYQIPLECQYLNKTALSRIIPELPQPPKHFTLRRKPKSAALRAKITQKANEAVNQRRLSSSINIQPTSGKANLKRVNSLNVPISHSKSGLPKSNITKKTKLLDIADQPIGVREQKKRKKILAMEMHLEETKQRKQNKESKKAATVEEESTTTKAQKPEVIPQNNLDTTTSGNETEPEQSETDSSILKPEDESTDEHTSDAKDSDVPSTPSYLSSIPEMSNLNSENDRLQTMENPPPPNLHPVIPEAPKNIPSDLVNIDPNASMATQNLQREFQMRIQEEQRRLRHHQQQQQMLNQQLLHNQHMQSFQQQQQAAFAMSSGLMQNRFHSPFQQMQPPVNLTHPPQPPPQPSSSAQQQQQQKKVLSLSREKMLAAQEMFKSANCVERAEKALILAFMAGSRENPFPQQGPVITIKLSEHMENVPPTPQADGTISSGQTTIIEMLFEMNFDTGLWRRLRRTRVVAQQQQQQG